MSFLHTDGYDFAGDDFFEELITFNNADEIASLLDSGYWDDEYEEAAAYAALDHFQAIEDREIEVEDFEWTLKRARDNYERAQSMREIVHGYEIEGFHGIDLQDYSAGGTCDLVSALGAASLSVIGTHGKHSAVAAMIDAAHEMESACLKGMLQLKRVWAGKVGA